MEDTENRQIRINGIGVSPGIAVGRARVVKKQKVGLTGVLLDDDEAILLEIGKFDHSVKISIEEVETMIARADETWSDEGVEILETQIEFLSDPQIRSDVLDKIQSERKNVNDAVIEAIEKLVNMFLEMTDEYMRARSADVQDIGDRILKNLESNVAVKTSEFEPETVIIAEDISPSDIISMDIKNVIGFATQIGGKTSHAAIVARSRGLPAVVGCGEILLKVTDGGPILMDGAIGEVIADPDEKTRSLYRSRRAAFFLQKDSLSLLKDVPAATRDGVEIKLVANISEADDLEQVFQNGGEGVGLLRSELLFMGRNSFPTEDEQCDFYKKVASKSQGKPVTIRTIDIGGDKQLPYFGLPNEQNPFLGYRAIRICLDRKDLFLVQLRAILRASVFGDLRIMFPMISNVQEIREAKEVLQEAKSGLLAESIKFNAQIPVGIMIEIPSAAVTADILAKEVDFFSIGTNDLIQYTLAVDRMNEKVSALYDSFNPGVLRLIANVIEQGHNKGIEVAMCGELAGDPVATQLLMGMGLKEFSMSAVSIPTIKDRIVKSSFLETQAIWQHVKEMESSDEIRGYLKGLNV